MSWNILFFETSRGERPVEHFLRALPVSPRTKAARILKLLQVYGPELGMPQAKRITTNLYELRVRGEIEIRIFYAFKHNTIYLLHIFQKKGQKTPLRDLEMARKRLQLLD